MKLEWIAPSGYSPLVGQKQHGEVFNVNAESGKILVNGGLAKKAEIKTNKNKEK